MDSGLGSDDDRRAAGKTKEQKQLRNQQLLSGCFIDASSLSDDSEVSLDRRHNERRQGALIFNSSIPHYSMLQMSCENVEEIATPFNSIVQIQDVPDETHKSPLGFYVDLNDVPEVPEVSTSSSNNTKNIFSFVIDFEAPKKEKPASLSRKPFKMKPKLESCSDSGSSSNSGPSEQVKTVETKAPQKNFVKLSDLECQSTGPHLDLDLKPRMSRSIPESSWVESQLMMTRSTGFRSTTRPIHFNESSSSERTQTDPKKAVQRLGTDLLRMFLEEIGPDVTIEVENHKIKAHKCILASRCQYFAALLSGNWLEDSGNVIQLTGFSYEAVYFSLCHIYSGAAHVPDSISVIELASLADMLGLEGLKEVVEHSLSQRYCHNFHKPCAGCSSGVIEVLMLSAAYGLDDLYQKCLNWIGQHFVKIWPSKGFSNLPRELREKCCQHHVVNLTPDKVLEIQSSCDKIMALLPGLTGRWVEPIQTSVQMLIEACRTFLRKHYAAVLVSPSFLALDSGPAWCINQVEDQMVSTATGLSVDQACKSYTRCCKMLEQHWSGHFEETLNKMKTALEQCLLAQSDKLNSRSNAWLRLDSHSRTRIKNLIQPVPTKARRSDPVQSSNNNQRVSSGSPSLRRSLLLAAKAPQVPPSPVLNTRKSTLTKPTASSSAKTARNVVKVESKSTCSSPQRSPLKARTTAPLKQIPPPQVNVKSELKKELPPPPIVPKMNKITQQRMMKAANSKQNTRPTSTSQVQNSKKSLLKNPRKNTSGVKHSNSNSKKAVGVMQRSDTFLKEEPSVIGKI